MSNFTSVDDTAKNDPVRFARDVLGLPIHSEQAQLIRNLDLGKPIRILTSREIYEAEKRAFARTLIPVAKALGWKVVSYSSSSRA